MNTPTSPNPAPAPVKLAGGLLGLEALGILVFAVVALVSGLHNKAQVGQLIGQCVYYVIIAGLIVLVGLGLIGGRRWARSPAIVVQLVVVAVGVWLVAPSGRIGWGIGLIVIGGITGGLLFTPAANAWIKRFPPLFGPEPDP